MIVFFIVTFCIITALGFGAAAAWSDFNSLKIPNIYSILIGTAFVIAFVAMFFFSSEVSLFGSWKNHFLSGLIMFLITLALFYFNKIGGGDAKLISVISLWVGTAGLMPFLFMMAITGGLLGGITLYLNKSSSVKSDNDKENIKLPHQSLWIKQAKEGARDVPYGIAIFVGALFSFWHSGFIQPKKI